MRRDARAQRALRTIRDCVAAGRVLVLPHFVQRLDEGGLVWPDVLAIVDAPDGVRSGSVDDFGRPKWIVTGPAATGERLEFVCVLDRDERGRVTVFVTIY